MRQAPQWRARRLRGHLKTKEPPHDQSDRTRQEGATDEEGRRQEEVLKK